MKPLSRARLSQLKRVREGKCRSCDEPLFKGERCETHYRDYLEDQRQYRKQKLEAKRERDAV